MNNKDAIIYYETLAELLKNQDYAAEKEKELDRLHENPETAVANSEGMYYHDFGMYQYRVKQAQKKLDEMKKRGVIPTAGDSNQKKVRTYQSKQATEVKRSGYSALASDTFVSPAVQKGIVYPIFKEGAKYFIVDMEGNKHATLLRDTKYYWVYKDNEVELIASRFADEQIGESENTADTEWLAVGNENSPPNFKSGVVFRVKKSKLQDKPFYVETPNEQGMLQFFIDGSNGQPISPYFDFKKEGGK